MIFLNCPVKSWKHFNFFLLHERDENSCFSKPLPTPRCSQSFKSYQPERWKIITLKNNNLHFFNFEWDWMYFFPVKHLCLPGVRLQSLRAQFLRLLSLLTPTASLGGPKNLPQIQSFARKTHRTPWKLSPSWLRFIARKGYRKSSQRRRCIEQSLGSIHSLSSGCATLSARMRDMTRGASPTWEAHLSFGVQSFYGGFIM